MSHSPSPLAALVVAFCAIACQGTHTIDHGAQPKKQESSKSSPTPEAPPKVQLQVSALAQPAPTAPAEAAPPVVEEEPPKPLTAFEREQSQTEGAPDPNAKKRGRLLFAARDFTGCQAALRNALSTSPKDSEVWTLLGRAYLKTGETNRGVDCLKEAATLAPTNGDIPAFLTRAYLEADNGGAALLAARTLAEVDPKSFRSAYLLGRAYSVNLMWAEALEVYETAITKKPDHAFANNNLGFAALMVGETDKAVLALETATAQESVRPYMFNNLGIAYERSNNPLSAMTAFHRALRQKPDYVKAIVNRDRVSATLTPEQHAEYVAWQDGTLFDQSQVPTTASEVESSTLAASSEELPPSSEEASGGESPPPENVTTLNAF